MSKWFGGLLIIAAMGAVVGCENGDEQMGGPGADVRTDQDQEPQQEEMTFTPSLDSESLEVPVGQEKELTLSIDRGEQFDQAVTVQINPPEGLTADPEQIELAAGQTEAQVMLRATQNAPVGEELAVEIQFQPETGESVTKQLTVTVQEAAAANENENQNQDENAVNLDTPDANREEVEEVQVVEPRDANVEIEE